MYNVCILFCFQQVFAVVQMAWQRDGVQDMFYSSLVSRLCIVFFFVFNKYIFGFVQMAWQRDGVQDMSRRIQDMARPPQPHV